MAKAKKKPKKRTKSKSKSKRQAAAAPRRKKTSKKKAGKTKARPVGGGRRSSEVERTWSEYWQCRTALEKAVVAVQEAEESLSSARDLERTCREVFDRTKNSLKSLLEVEPASGDRGGSFDFTGKGLSVPELDDEPSSR